MERIKINMNLFRDHNNKLFDKISDEALALYIALKINENEFCHTLDIYKILSNNKIIDYKENLVKKIPKAVFELTKLNLIKTIQQKNKYCYQVKLLETNQDLQNNYFWIDVEDIYKIFCGKQKHPNKILKHYLCVASTINHISKIGVMSNISFSKRLNCTRQTIINRNNKLKKLNLICYKERKDMDNFQKSNLYTLSKNKDCLNLFDKIKIDNNITIEIENDFKQLIMSKNLLQR